MTFFRWFFAAKPVRVEDIFGSEDRVDVHSFRARERLEVHMARTELDLGSGVVRRSVRYWPKRTRRIA